MTRSIFVLVLLAPIAATGCRNPEPPADRSVVPIYSKQTGRLEALVSDADGDGVMDTRAVMDGVRLSRVEIDRNADGRPDRWEYYAPAADGAGVPTIERAEESDNAEGRITRREFYASGVIERVEEDTDGDGRTDKWERYANGTLQTVELDLMGAGRPTQRLVYTAQGAVTRVETDPDGDGRFEVVSGGARP